MSRSESSVVGWTRSAAIACAVAVIALLCFAIGSSSASAAGLALSPFGGNGVRGTGAPASGVPATSVSLDSPAGGSVDAAGNVYFADAFSPFVGRISPGGTLTVLAGTGHSSRASFNVAATSSPLVLPLGVAAGPDGSVYIADAEANQVYRVTPSGILTQFAGQPDDVAGPATPGPAASSRLNDPSDVAVDAAGNVYIADTGNDQVDKVTPAGTLSVLAGHGAPGAAAGGSATASGLRGPLGVAAGPDGDIYIADTGNSAVERVTPTGTLAIVAGTGTAGAAVPGRATSSPLNGPRGVDVDATGDVFIADTGNRRVEEVGPGGYLAVIAGNGTVGPPNYGVPAVDSPLIAQSITVNSSDQVYVLGDDNNTIDTFTPAPTPSLVPSITGNAVVGATLTARTGTWTNHPMSYQYQWSRCSSTGTNCTRVAGATSMAYRATNDDYGHALVVTETGTNSAGSASADSTPSAPINEPGAASGPGASRPPATSEGASCPAATGKLSGNRLGIVTLGLSRRQAGRRLPARKAAHGFQSVCLKGGSIRFAYAPSAALRHLSRKTQRSVRGTIVLALTTNRHYAVGKIKPGAKVGSGKHRLRLPRGIRVSGSTWYLIGGRGATAVIRVQGGVVREVGIAASAVTGTPSEAITLLRSA
ncbi:MAG: hypothetical protein JOZ07_13465 [Solirubrobacterales bacterium]|nr:hypothetical protein [Solirubrobacterales bacterium]